MWIFIAWINIGLVLAANRQCPDLTPGANMRVSQVEGWINDVPVQVSCDAGYVLDTATLVKNITCVPDNDDAVWNETVGACQRKACPSVDTVLGNYSIADSVDQLYYGDNVTISCVYNYAFSIDYGAGDGDRLKVSRTVTCDDIPASTIGVLSDVGSCSEITCEIPMDVPNAVKTYTNLTVNSRAQYSCYTGYTFNGAWFSMYAMCNDSAMWETSFNSGAALADSRCFIMDVLLGCMEFETMLFPSSTQLAVNGAKTCTAECKIQNNRFAGLYNGTCFCGDDLAANWTTLEPGDCNQTCQGYDPDTPGTNVFCGGPGQKLSVFVTLHGCYDQLDLSEYTSESVPEVIDATCTSRCRGADYSHAVVHDGNMCTCINSTSVLTPTTSTVGSNKCTNTSLNGVYDVFDLAKFTKSYSTCEELFADGVRLNGHYYFEEPRRKEACYFKDGTNCSDGWIGFRDNCYHFSNKHLLDFSNASLECQSLNAELVSILSPQEYLFLLEVRTVFSDVWIDSVDRSWLGLVDAKGMLLYTWVDGNMMKYSNWNNEPSDHDLQCVAGRMSKSFRWMEAHCDNQFNYICKRAADGPSCVLINAFTPDHTRTLVDMTTTACSQYCKGKQTTYMLLKNDTCHCVNNLPAHTEVPKTNCSVPCAGNIYQLCGGDDEMYGVRNVTTIMPAKSCEELQLIGVDNGTFEVQPDDVSELHYCPATECDYGWVNLLDHCYKFVVWKRYLGASIADCASEDGYIITIETMSEIENVIAAANNISVYSVHDSWRIGLNALSMNDGAWMWSNGRQVDYTQWNISIQGGPDVVVNADDYLNWIGHTSDERVYICEKGEDYVGCFSDNNTNVVIEDYPAMTIQLCVETCRALLISGTPPRYALLNRTSCGCELAVSNGDRMFGQCSSVCSGQYNQICGGPDGVVSVYDIDSYPTFANSCLDIFNAGIHVSGYYEIAGARNYCHLIDGDGCDLHWLNIGGSCYRRYAADTTVSQEETCRQNNATQTSLATRLDYDSLVEYITHIDFWGHNTRVFTGIGCGAYNLNVFISSDGLLTDYGLIDSQTLSTADLFDSMMFVSFRVDQSNVLDENGGVICKSDRYFIGCFNTSPSLGYKLTSFGSMEMGLCRQICIAANSEVYLIGDDFCACASETDVAGLTSSEDASCGQQCVIHADQRCGNGSSALAYSTGEADVPYAHNCSHLYRTGIFYETTYKTQMPNESAITQTCGFADNTLCAPSWLGKDGLCFKFIQVDTEPTTAIATCMVYGAYIFNPTWTITTMFVSSFLTTSGLFDPGTTMLSGVWPVTYNTSYTESSGRIVHVDFASQTNMPTLYSGYDASTSEWVSLADDSSFICQTDPEYFGCVMLEESNAVESFYGVLANSLTTCSQLCLTTSGRYAATYINECHCFLDVSGMTSYTYTGICVHACPGNQFQSCGGFYLPKQFTMVNITTWSGLNGTCADLYKYGVRHPSFYLLRHPSQTEHIKTQCFSRPDPMDNIHYDIKSTRASSEMVEREADKVRFSERFVDAWKPEYDQTGEYVKVNLNQEYLITAVTIKGLHTAGEQSFVTSYWLKYRDVLSGDLMNYTENAETAILNGCSRSPDICTTDLLDPFVSNEIYFYPVTWHNSIAVQLLFSGTPYSTFQHSTFYVGCVADFDNGMEVADMTATVEDCINICRNQTEPTPFSSLDSWDACWCGDIRDASFVEEQHCDLDASGQNRLGVGSFRAVRRTFYKHCETPEPGLVTNGNLTEVVYAHQEGVLSYKSTAIYTCTRGYQTPEDKTFQESYCLQTNAWSKLKYNCSIISCPMLDVDNGNVTVEDTLEYGGSVTVRCNKGFWAENSDSKMTVTCQHDKTWSTHVTCSASNLHKIDRGFSIVEESKRPVDTVSVSEIQVRSYIDCAARCANQYYCRGANFKQSDTPHPDAGTCRLFLKDSDGVAFDPDPEWKYLHVQ